MKRTLAWLLLFAALMLPTATNAAPATGAQGTYINANGQVLPGTVTQIMGLENGNGALCLVGSDTTCELPGSGGGGGGGGAVFGPTANGSPAVNPPVLLGGTANGAGNGNVENVKVTSDGLIHVSVDAGGGTGGTSSSYAAPFPATGTAIGVSNGTNMVAITQGSAVAASSLPVVIASDQAAVAVKAASAAFASGSIASGAVASGAVASGAVASGAFAVGAISAGGDVTEGLTTDTCAGSGSNCTVDGRMQSLQAIAAGAIPGGTNAIGSVIPNAVTSTNGSTTVVTGNTFQTILASNASRKGCLIQNPSDATETLYVNVKDAVGSATKPRSYQLPAGASFSCTYGGNVITDIINVTAVTSAHAFVESDQ